MIIRRLHRPVFEAAIPRAFGYECARSEEICTPYDEYQSLPLKRLPYRASALSWSR
jgi:hypothetical protein